MRRVLASLIVVLGSFVIPALFAPPAVACTIGFDPNAAPAPAVDYLARSDVAFLGDAVATEVVDPLDETAVARSSDPALRWTFLVRDVYKGQVAARQQLVLRSECGGPGLQLNHRYVVYGCRQPGPELLICGGTFEPDGHNTHPPDVPSEPPLILAGAAVRPTESDTDAGTSPWAVVAGGLSGVVLTLLAGLLKGRAPTR